MMPLETSCLLTFLSACDLVHQCVCLLSYVKRGCGRTLGSHSTLVWISLIWGCLHTTMIAVEIRLDFPRARLGIAPYDDWIFFFGLAVAWYSIWFGVGWECLRSTQKLRRTIAEKVMERRVSVSDITLRKTSLIESCDLGGQYCAISKTNTKRVGYGLALVFAIVAAMTWHSHKGPDTGHTA
jgi:hypothetical protein